ncbi:MAG: DNA recombination protein RmuC [Caldimicrobium sp.]
MKELFLISLIYFLLLLVGLLLIYHKLKSYFESKFSESFFPLKERLSDLTEIKRDLQKLYLAEDLLNTLKSELFKLSQIFISRGSGKSGERALEKTLSLLPEHILSRNLKIAGGEVEFALKLDEDKFIPVDSKFIKPDLLQKENLTIEEERELIKSIRERAKEIAFYLKDERSVGMGIMTCPDGLFPLLQRKVFEDLEKEKILLVPYSLLLQILLFIHFLWHRFHKNIDSTDFTEFTGKLERFFYELERDIEKLSREIKSVINLLERIREEERWIKREYLKLKRDSQSSINSKGISE